MEKLGFGIIGLGLMGREFASASSRWCHLPDMDVRPEIVALCDKYPNPETVKWFQEHFPSVTQVTEDYRELLENPSVKAVYIAVPHNLHEEIYCACINAGKHLFGEKPFGIDRRANDAILKAIAAHPESFVRGSSQFPFFPGMQRICTMIERDALGTVIEVEAGFLHSSDLSPDKPINWKRMIDTNGEYGCMGDLGMHVCHVPFRAGWVPRNVRAILSNIVAERPDGKGGRVPCETWDNATLFCEAADERSGTVFPMTLKTQRIAPGEMDTWYFSVLGTRSSARFTSRNPQQIQVLEYSGGDQNWQAVQTGQQTAFKSITGGIFEFGFSDAVLQMWAAYLYEMKHGKPKKRFAACVTPEETALSHRLFSAALESQKKQAVVPVR